MQSDIQKIFVSSYEDFSASGYWQSAEQKAAAHAIILCKSGRLGANRSVCDNCGFSKIHYNSCRNRHCPNCQAVSNEVWSDKRRSEVISAPYFHVVFTLPHELNSLILCNQKPLYSLLHRCTAQTLLELSADRKFLGAAPGIIQVLHTWNQELDYHVHMHCIVSGGGITPDGKLRLSKGSFFIPVFVLRDKFRGKFLALLDRLYKDGLLSFPKTCDELHNSYSWNGFRDSLYHKDWCPYIKETFNGFGNAIDYLGRYTHRIAISNSRILSVSDSSVSFSARGKRPGDPKRTVTLTKREFIRRFLLHVLPSGFQKIRYYGFLNNRTKSKNLDLIAKLQNRRRMKARYAGLSMREFLRAAWNIDICLCPNCGMSSMHTVRPDSFSSA